VIGGWLVKVLVGIAILGFAAVELGSPLVARAQADDAAHDVADEAAFRIRDDFTEKAMKEACDTEAAKHSVTVTVCDYDTAKQEVVVTVTKHARSFLLDKFDATKDWYVVEASARSEKK
jgi:hypothetical protein